MTDVSSFRTPKRRGRIPRKFAQRDELNSRLLAQEIASKKRQSTETIIAELQKAVRMLDLSIKAQLDSVWIADPSHFAFPLTARSLVTRRDNLTATIAALSKQLER